MAAPNLLPEPEDENHSDAISPESPALEYQVDDTDSPHTSTSASSVPGRAQRDAALLDAQVVSYRRTMAFCWFIAAIVFAALYLYSR